jgi:hypothetical protein
LTNQTCENFFFVHWKFVFIINSDKNSINK